MAWNQAVRRFQAHDTTKWCRLPYWTWVKNIFYKILLCTIVVHTASVASKSSSTLLQGDGRCRTAGRTSRNPTHIPGITGYAKSRVFGRAAHAKFIKIRLSKYNASLRLHVAWKYWMLRSGNTLRNQGCTNLYSRDYQRTVWRSMRLWGYHNKKNWLLYFKSELSCFSCCPQLG